MNNLPFHTYSVEGGNYMRILVLAVVIFIIIHFVRIDLMSGTIPIAAFANQASQSVQCDETETFSIAIASVTGDTIETLFALYPDPTKSFLDRLNDFYKLNPHLQLQDIVGGEKVLLPLYRIDANNCLDSKR